MDAIPIETVRVEFSTLEDVRRVLFLELALLPERQRADVARRITAKLRDGGWLATSVEQLYKASQVAGLVSRSCEHVVKECKAGRFGTVYRDDGGWLIPASGVQAWLDRKQYSQAEVLA